LPGDSGLMPELPISMAEFGYLAPFRKALAQALF
jgi:hypothetical protein